MAQSHGVLFAASVGKRLSDEQIQDARRRYRDGEAESGRRLVVQGIIRRESSQVWASEAMGLEQRRVYRLIKKMQLAGIKSF